VDIDPEDIRRPYGVKYKQYREYYMKHPIIARIACFLHGHEWRPHIFNSKKCIRCGKRRKEKRGI
jgi:hypothetical protein